MKDFIMSKLSAKPVPKNFKPLSRAAYRYAQRNGIKIQKLGPKQQKWVNALLSGDYNKSRCYLRVEDNKGKQYHCCLGVACELTPNVDIDFADFTEAYRGFVNGYNSAYSVNYTIFNCNERTLPDSVSENFAFYDDCGIFEDFWVDGFEYLDNEGEFKDCDSLREIRRYVKTFKLLANLEMSDLTDMNDGREVAGEPYKDVVYSHKQIANFVKAYPQAIFEKPV